MTCRTHFSWVARRLLGFHRQSGAPAPGRECRRPSASAAAAVCQSSLPPSSARPVGVRRSTRRCQAARRVAALTATGGRGASIRSRTTDQKKRSPMKGSGSRPELGLGEKLARRARPLGQGGKRLALGQRQAVRRPRQFLQVPLQGALEERQFTADQTSKVPRAARESGRARPPRHARRAPAGGG